MSFYQPQVEWRYRQPSQQKLKKEKATKCVHRKKENSRNFYQSQIKDCVSVLK
jgi:hypothetical protein